MGDFDGNVFWRRWVKFCISFSLPLSLSPYGFNSFNLSCSSLAVLEAALGDLDDLEGLACLVDLC